MNCIANKFHFYFSRQEYGGTGVGPPATGASQNIPPPGVQQQRPAHAREYNFLDMELKYGILQVSLPISI
jgi:SCY1-like protein 2